MFIHSERSDLSMPWMSGSGSVDERCDSIAVHPQFSPGTAAQESVRGCLLCRSWCCCFVYGQACLPARGLMNRVI